MTPVTCPTCFEVFEVAAPGLGELPAEWDYDCEVCCRPMVLTVFEDEAGEIGVQAMSVDGHTESLAIWLD